MKHGVNSGIRHKIHSNRKVHKHKVLEVHRHFQGKCGDTMRSILFFLLVVLVVQNCAGQQILDDDKKHEAGAEWVNHYGRKDRFEYCDDSGGGLVRKLVSIGWTGWEFGNSSAWECDFTTCQDDYADDVDIVIFSGHGRKLEPINGPLFSVFMLSDHLTPLSCRTLGNKDLEWMALDCCDALSNGSFQNWASSMHGLHLILGFKTKCYDVPLGKTFAEKMIHEGLTVMAAWFTAADCEEPKNKEIVARVIGETAQMGSDYLWGLGNVSPDPTVDSWFYYWDHVVSCIDYSNPVDRNQGEIPLFKVIPKEITKDYVKWIGKKFCIRGEVHTYEIDGIVYYVVRDEDGIMTVSEHGEIRFIDLTRLWMPLESQPRLPTEFKAKEIAKRVLKWTRLTPDDGSLYKVCTDTQAKADKMTGEVIEQIDMNYQVIFNREIDYEGVMYPVVNSIIKVYIGECGRTTGFFYSWRDVELVGTIPVISPDEALDLFLEQGNQAAVVGLKCECEECELVIEDISLGYYQTNTSESQDYLVPVYILDVAYVNQEEKEKIEAEIMVPAAPEFIPPIVRITSPEDDSVFRHGEPIAFAGEVVAFGEPPFSFEWYSDIDGHLESGPSIVVSDLSPSPKEREEVLRPHIISLVVTDSAGRSNTDFVRITIKQPEESSPSMHMEEPAGSYSILVNTGILGVLGFFLLRGKL